MAVDPRRRQKKLMKKRRKDKTRKKAAPPPFSGWGARQKLNAARGFQIHECLINEGWRRTGIATILVSRRQPDGQLTVGAYLVDLCCLGLKDTSWHVDVSTQEYKECFRDPIIEETQAARCSTALAHHVIYGAIEFAARFGFDPHQDFHQTQLILDDVDDLRPCEETIEFGKDGKPVYVQGPQDDPAAILRHLETAVGPDNYQYICRAEDEPIESQLEALAPEMVDIAGEAASIIRTARDRKSKIVALGSLVFFATDTGDAWMLDPKDHLALPLARDGDALPYAIKEAAESFSVEWTADYQIDGEMFVVFERTGRARLIYGYPVVEIEKACRRALEQASGSFGAI